MGPLLGLLLFGRPIAGPVGEPADVASSAYAYRADRKVEANPPESFVAIMQATGAPLNQRLDPKGSAVAGTLCSLLWEENRPIETLVLTWPTGAKRQPRAEDLEVSALVPKSSASSWWNNLTAQQISNAKSSDSGRTYTFEVNRDTCGLTVRLRNGVAAGMDVPQVQAFEPYRWRPMSVEVEWGFQPGTEGRDYSGRVEAYDGRIAGIAPLDEDRQTETAGTNWVSRSKSARRRGIKLDLLYLGHTTWRHVQTWTTQPGDVARSIVTVWTHAGSFSFNPADLDHGPIYAPEFGFFVRRTSTVQPEPPAHLPVTPFTERMNSVTQSSAIKGWGTGATPLVCANPTDRAIESTGIRLPARSVAVHPGEHDSVVVSWRCPRPGPYAPSLILEHAQAGGIGIHWQLRRETSGGFSVLGEGDTDGKVGEPHRFSASAAAMKPGERLSLVVSNRGDYRSCTLIVNFSIHDMPGNAVWRLADDVARNILDANPHADGAGNPNVWTFGSQTSLHDPSDVDRSPIGRSSSARTGTEYLAELKRCGLQTIREQTRQHAEMTWEDAVHATRGADLPTMPLSPRNPEMDMYVDVPDDHLEAQWNIGAWHLLRHCATNPATGKLWFNDYPYGILAAETYLVLSVLDQLGQHEAAQAGFDQWTLLPLDRDHPAGLSTDGRGAFTFATGPPGIGGDMDGIHAFGPGSIAWALVQHYRLTGDTAWLKANAARIKANAEWMLRQREVMRQALPNGGSLWCAGLQPPLQVTPDSGGLWMQFYEAEGYYCCSIAELAEALRTIGDPDADRLARGAENYRRELRAAVDRSITLSPVIPVRDGTYHSVIPFACYCRGAATGAWGWKRDGSGSHVGPLYWDTVQNGASLVWPAGILSPKDVRIQGYLDVLEDRFLLENPYVGDRDWFFKGWQYQGGLERTANLNLVSDDPSVFLRSFLNDYAVDILPQSGYVFNEHAVHGPPDKIFEEAAFLERFRDMLVMEDGGSLWLARAIPSAWLAPGKHVAVTGASTAFGDLGFLLEALGDGSVKATIIPPTRRPPLSILLRLRVPGGKQMQSVTVNGSRWRAFDAKSSTIRISGQADHFIVVATYR